ncbi:hypothetical protein V6N13_012248 [Hibiscus sabdariffa]
MSAKIDLLETEVEKERALSAQITVKCREPEEELSRKNQEVELQQSVKSNVEVKIKQEDLATAAGKLAECQKTTASLGQQLKSLATLEGFLIDTTSIPELPKEIQSLQQLMRIRTMETHPIFIDCVVESCQFQEEQKRV